MANGYSCDQAVRPLEKLLLKFAQPRGYDIDKVFTGLLDYIIWQLDPMGGKIDYWPFKEGEFSAFLEMFQCLLEILNREIPQRGWYDAFGDLFMSLHAAGNSKGQFFTPASLCDMLAQVSMPTSEPQEEQTTPFGKRITINDCACGSSRLLLAGSVKLMKTMQDEWGWDLPSAYARRPYLCAEDIDFNCTKMSAINIALHGYFGECICHDTICEPCEVRLGYIINETMWPFPTNIPSIRKEMHPERFCTTRIWMQRRQQHEQAALQEPVQQSEQKPEPLPQVDAATIPNKPQKAVQLTFW